LDAADVVSLLNMHYTSVVDAIMSESGILDKYIGDAAMAVFGVPFTQADDALRSVSAALRMKQGLETLNRRNKIMKLPTLKMGVGISTGMVLSGNIGSPKRMEYTVIGEAVNIASRIENMTKMYGTMILICDKTQQAVRDRFHLREVDAIVVKGKTVPITIYEVLGTSEVDLPQEQMVGLK
jgi:adenylate cyclase